MYVESAARFRRIAEMQPASWQSQYNLAVALIKAKQSKEALPLLASLATEHASDANVLASVASPMNQRAKMRWRWTLTRRQSPPIPPTPIAISTARGC